MSKQLSVNELSCYSFAHLNSRSIKIRKNKRRDSCQSGHACQRFQHETFFHKVKLFHLFSNKLHLIKEALLCNESAVWSNASSISIFCYEKTKKKKKPISVAFIKGWVLVKFLLLLLKKISMLLNLFKQVASGGHILQPKNGCSFVKFLFQRQCICW